MRYLAVLWFGVVCSAALWTAWAAPDLPDQPSTYIQMYLDGKLFGCLTGSDNPGDYVCDPLVSGGNP